MLLIDGRRAAGWTSIQPRSADLYRGELKKGTILRGRSATSGSRRRNNLSSLVGRSPGSLLERLRQRAPRARPGTSRERQRRARRAVGTDVELVGRGPPSRAGTGRASRQRRWWSVAPSPQTSAAGPIGPRIGSHCSGAMYASVPIRAPARGRSGVRAMLRSISRGGTPMTMLSGLTSRCTRPRREVVEGPRDVQRQRQHLLRAAAGRRA